MKSKSGRNENISRIGVLMLGFALIWGAMIFRSFHIQVVQGEYYSGRADNQSLKRITRAPERGSILDRNLSPLVVNATIQDSASNSPRSLERVVLNEKNAAQVLGYVGKEKRGMLGLEYAYDEELRGLEGWTYRKMDVQRKFYPGFAQSGKEPQPGMNMVLTIDIRIQEILDAALKDGVIKTEAKSGTAVVMNPHTGEILAMGSYPTFNPNNPSSLKSGHTKNLFVAKTYEPGSTFKLITAAAALDSRSMKVSDSINGDQGRFKIFGDVITDTHKYDKMSFTDAMAWSSNVAFAKIAGKVGDKEFFKYVRAFGFGSPTGIELPAEEKGALKSVDQWSGRTLVTMAMGHEILSTPLQITMAFAAVANGGMLLKPRIIKEWRDSKDNSLIQESEKVEVRQVISEETAAEIRKILKSVVDRGTAENIKSEWLEFAGKTGTAEKYDAEAGKYARDKMVSSFVGMTPASQPALVCAVIIDEPLKFHYGSQAAAPVFKEIMEKIWFDAKLFAYRRPLLNLKENQKEPLAQSTSSSPFKASPDTKIHKPGVMPALEGLVLKDALKLLEQSGVNVKIEGFGKVSYQDPVAGTQLSHNSICTLHLKEDI
jgi:cell division protein FtsI/penicillin-binding protein 2